MASYWVMKTRGILMYLIFKNVDYLKRQLVEIRVLLMILEDIRRKRRVCHWKMTDMYSSLRHMGNLAEVLSDWDGSRTCKW